MRTYLLALLLFASASEIRAREAIKPTPDVGQIVKDLDGVHVDGAAQRTAPCALDIQRDFPTSKQQPLYLHPNSTTYWLPDADGQLQIEPGAPIELYCTSPISGVAGARQSLLVRCLNNKTFYWEGGKQAFRNFTCTQPMRFDVERTEEPCADGKLDTAAREYRVGYRISDDRFVITMRLCHDAEHLQTHYASHQLLPANVHYQSHVSRIQFTAAGLSAGYNMKKCYSRESQKQRVAELLQNHDNATLLQAQSFLQLGGYLTRGHLAPKADFIYASQQRTTFLYLNVAPQWQTFNSGHWNILENETRRLAARLGLSLTVYTGTYGVMAGPRAANKSFHLTTDAADRDVLPVPQLFYRVIVDNQNPSSGLATIGVNNPHDTLGQIKHYYICPPIDASLVSWQMRWLHNKDLKKGYMYACRVADMAKTVGHLPPHLNMVTNLIEDPTRQAS